MSADTIKLSTGREIYANSGIIGIDADGSVFQGYDGIVFVYDSDEEGADRIALAKMMIERWAIYLKKAEES